MLGPAKGGIYCSITCGDGIVIRYYFRKKVSEFPLRIIMIQPYPFYRVSSLVGSAKSTVWMSIYEVMTPLPNGNIFSTHFWFCGCFFHLRSFMSDYWVSFLCISIVHIFFIFIFICPILFIIDCFGLRCCILHVFLLLPLTWSYIDLFRLFSFSFSFPFVLFIQFQTENENMAVCYVYEYI